MDSCLLVNSKSLAIILTCFAVSLLSWSKGTFFLWSWVIGNWFANPSLQNLTNYLSSFINIRNMTRDKGHGKECGRRWSAFFLLLFKKQTVVNLGSRDLWLGIFFLSSSLFFKTLIWQICLGVKDKSNQHILLVTVIALS